MKYVFFLEDKKEGTLTEELLLSHVEHLKQLKEDGSLFICGPFKDDKSALQILIAESKKQAIDLIESDPFIANGYYQSYIVKELIEANEDNHWLISHPQTNGNKLR